MNYIEKSQEIKSYITEIESVVNTITNNSINSVWIGDTSNSQLEQLNNYITSLEQEIAKIKQLAESLELLQSYKENDENIENLNNRLNDIVYKNGDQTTINELNKKISSLQSTNSSLKSSINSTNNINHISSTNKKVTYVVPELNVSLDVA